ncbi:MAG: CPBP family intramembrane metalloprotease, partial [Roseiflexus sp.]|nr:CPBP family intramembrane metalloprotease [Roseiflexus sp.]
METLHPPAPRLPLPGAPRAAIGALVADLLIAIGMALILSVAVVGVMIGLRAAQTGLDVDALGQLNPQEITRLIGVDGMLTLLLLQNLVFIGVAVIRVRVLRRAEPQHREWFAPQPLRL